MSCEEASCSSEGFRSNVLPSWFEALNPVRFQLQRGSGVEVVAITYSELKSSIRAALPGLLQQPPQLLSLVLAGGAIPSPGGLVLPSGSLLQPSLKPFSMSALVRTNLEGLKP